MNKCKALLSPQTLVALYIYIYIYIYAFRPSVRFFPGMQAMVDYIQYDCATLNVLYL